MFATRNIYAALYLAICVTVYAMAIRPSVSGTVQSLQYIVVFYIVLLVIMDKFSLPNILATGLAPEGVADIEAKAVAGDSNAQFMLGLRLLNQNKHEALRLLEASARSGNTIAAGYVADMYVNGEDGAVTPNYKLAIRYFRMALDNPKKQPTNPLMNPFLSMLGGQDTLLQAGLGYALLLDGQISQGCKQLQDAVEKGSARAAYYLGRCYLKGLMLPKNEQQGCLCLLKAMKLDQCTVMYSGPAAYLLGGHYAEKGDYARALKMFEKSADLKCNSSLLELGKLYSLGMGCTADQKKAYELFSKALQCNIKGAHYQLACCYSHGIGVARDMRKAVEHLELGVKDGCYDCYGYLGFMLCVGYDVPKDESRGMQLMQESAAAGSETGLANIERYKMLKGQRYDAKKLAGSGDCITRVILGFNMIYGVGVAKRPKEGYELLHSAMNESEAKTNPACLCCQGICLGDGIPGVLDADLEVAEILLGEAARLGVVVANTQRGLVLLKQGNSEKAVECFRIAHEHGDANGTFNLALCHECGCGVTKDLAKARSYLEQCRSSHETNDVLIAKVDELLAQMASNQTVPASSHAQYDTVCSICTESFEDDADQHVLACKHAYHRNCLMLYFRHFLLQRLDGSLPSCPNCRAAIGLDVIRSCGVESPNFN